MVTPFGDTLFVGLYYCSAVGRAPAGTIDPLGQHDAEGLFEYTLERRTEMLEYAGRVVIEWGEAYRAWVQRADKQNKHVIELKKSSAIDPPFPGFAKFRHSIRTLSTVPHRWRDALAAVSGVYVLASATTGKLYVGSAHGGRGFWGRWEEYYRSGHGGNVGMRSNVGEDLIVSILEVAASTASEQEILAMEALWKDRLLSKKFGLNRN